MSIKEKKIKIHFLKQENRIFNKKLEHVHISLKGNLISFIYRQILQWYHNRSPVYVMAQISPYL